jgi:hypothetical protein
VIEFKSSIGSKMRIQWKGSSTPDWAICSVPGGKRNYDPYHGADARAGGDRSLSMDARDRFFCDWRERVKAPLSESDHDKLKDALHALAQPDENVPGRLERPRVGSEKPMTLIKRR